MMSLCSHIVSAPETTQGTRTEVRLGHRAHNTRTIDRAHAPPTTSPGEFT
jgi:hypothetical protein